MNSDERFSGFDLIQNCLVVYHLLKTYVVEFFVTSLGVFIFLYSKKKFPIFKQQHVFSLSKCLCILLKLT